MSQTVETKIPANPHGDNDQQVSAPPTPFHVKPHLIIMADMVGYDDQEEVIDFHKLTLCNATDFYDACNQLRVYRREGYAPVMALTKKDLRRLLRAMKQQSLEAVGLSDLQNEDL